MLGTIDDAVARGDHVQAIVWFERASPLLETPVPAAAIESGEHGETFVSMAVSYWEQQAREESMDMDGIISLISRQD